jgi:hypothetical protein
MSLVRVALARNIKIATAKKFMHNVFLLDNMKKGGL